MAAIDCGTNSTRLLVADADGAALERQMRITRLGEGVDATGELSPDAIDRTVAVLGEYRAVMDRSRRDEGPAGGHLGAPATPPTARSSSTAAR